METYRRRERLLVRYADDPRLWHWRAVLAVGRTGGGACVYTVVTPDREVQNSVLGAPTITKVVRWPWS